MKKYAFSLEFVVVLIAIAVLAGVAIPAYTRSKDNAKEADVKNGLHSIQLVVERYAVDTEGVYPPYLIGGDIRYEPNWDPNLPFDCLGEGFPQIMDRFELSDPLLRAGYIESYPKNPFVNERGKFAMVKLQESVKDPLRNGMIQGVPSEGAIGNRHGCRFGGDGWIMGNVSCDYRYPTFEATNPDGTVAEYPTGADFEGYPFFDVWVGRKPKFYLPGEFFYKSFGSVVAADPDEVDKDRTIQPVEIDQYIMGAYGSLHTRGFDVLGPEPLIRGFTSGTGVFGAPAIPYSTDGGKLFPFHTRWTNTPDENGRFQGSPYGETTDNLISQITAGNPNGIKDGIILVLTSGEDVKHER